MKTEAIVVYLERLYNAKQEIEKRISALGGADDSVGFVFAFRFISR